MDASSALALHFVVWRAGEAGAAPATARAPAKPPAGGVVLRKLTDEEREGRQSALDEAKRKAQQEAKKRFGGEEGGQGEAGEDGQTSV
jgi:hypothetical protein